MKNAEVAISIGGGDKKFEDWGEEGLKSFRNGGVTDLERNYFCWGGSVPYYMPLLRTCFRVNPHSIFA